MSFNIGPIPSSEVTDDILPAFPPASTNSTLTALEQQIAVREDQADERDWELDQRESAIDDAAAETIAKENMLDAREQRLVQYVSNLTGQQIAAGQSTRNFLNGFDWTTMPFPPGFVGGGIDIPSIEDALDDEWSPPTAPAEDFADFGGLAAESSVDTIHESIEPFESETLPEGQASSARTKRMAIPDMQAKLRTMPSKRKREMEVDEDGSEPSKKAKVVIDLTGED